MYFEAGSLVRSYPGSCLIMLPMQTSVFELLTCVVWGRPECYVMQERGTGIEAEYG